MKKKLFILWSIWSVLGALLIYVVTSSASKNNYITTIAMVISLSPLLGLLLALGSVKAANQFKKWLNENGNSIYILTGGITVLFALPGLLTGDFDLYFTVIFASIILVVFGLLIQHREKEFKLNWSDAAIWLILWIPFDLRWYMEMQTNLDYTWWSVAISLIAVIGWYGYRGAEIGFNLVPKIKDILIVLSALVMIMALLVPPGLITGFLSFSIPESFDFPMRTAHFIGLFLTVALPEELFFRGILLRGLDNLFSKKWIPLLISSLAFGLMHWNNVATLYTQITYVSLATIAGLGYGWAYQKSGNNLIAAILTHTLVDWIWKLLFAV